MGVCKIRMYGILLCSTTHTTSHAFLRWIKYLFADYRQFHATRFYNHFYVPWRYQMGIDHNAFNYIHVTSLTFKRGSLNDCILYRGTRELVYSILLFDKYCNNFDSDQLKKTQLFWHKMQCFGMTGNEKREFWHMSLYFTLIQLKKKASFYDTPEMNTL